MADREIPVVTSNTQAVALVLDDEDVFTWCVIRGGCLIKRCRSDDLVAGCDFDALVADEEFAVDNALLTPGDLESAVGAHLV